MMSLQAADNDDEEMVKVLLKYGGNVNAKACDGCTPVGPFLVTRLQMY
jgi:ankyrin repeat protein